MRVVGAFAAAAARGAHTPNRGSISRSNSNSNSSSSSSSMQSTRSDSAFKKEVARLESAIRRAQGPLKTTWPPLFNISMRLEGGEEDNAHHTQDRTKGHGDERANGSAAAETAVAAVAATAQVTPSRDERDVHASKIGGGTGESTDSTGKKNERRPSMYEQVSLQDKKKDDGKGAKRK